MHFKFIVINVIFFCFITFSQSIYAFTEVEKLAIANSKNGIPIVTPKLVKAILSACIKDKQSKQPISEKEKKACEGFIKAEKDAQDSYNNFIKACAYRNMADSANLTPGFYDQYFVNYLLKRNAIHLLHSQNINDLIKLNNYKNESIKELAEKLLPSFAKECKKENPYDVYYLAILNRSNSNQQFT